MMNDTASKMILKDGTCNDDYMPHLVVCPACGGFRLLGAFNYLDCPVCGDIQEMQAYSLEWIEGFFDAKERKSKNPYFGNLRCSQEWTEGYQFGIGELCLSLNLRR